MTKIFAIYIFSTLTLISIASTLLPSKSSKENKKSRILVLENFIQIPLKAPDNLQYNNEQKYKNDQKQITTNVEIIYSGYNYNVQPFDKEQKQNTANKSEIRELEIKNKQKTLDMFNINLTPTKFILPPKNSVVPKLVGSYIDKNDKQNKKESQNNKEAISNPIAYFLKGADFRNIKTPKCTTSCDGLVVSDYNLYSKNNKDSENNTCQFIFISLNSCIGKHGYPIGMQCKICCDCNNDFIFQMKKSVGYKKDFTTQTKK